MSSGRGKVSLYEDIRRRIQEDLFYDEELTSKEPYREPAPDDSHADHRIVLGMLFVGVLVAIIYMLW